MTHRPLAHRAVGLGHVARAAMVAAGLAACGGGGAAHRAVTKSAPPAKPAPPPSPYAAARDDVCRGQGRRVIGRVLRVPPGAVSGRRTLSGAQAPECIFTVHSHGRSVVISASVDGSPQAYGVMERRGEEEGQLFTSKRMFPAPVAVFHLGLGAYWYPDGQQLQTTDAVNLITVTIQHWPGVPERRHRQLAISLARSYLGPSRPGLIRSDG